MSKENKLIILAVTLLIALGLLVIYVPCPTDFIYIYFRIVIALAAGALAAVIPGFLRIKYQGYVSAGGGLGVFVFVFVYTPQLIDSTKKCEPITDITVFLEDEDGDIILQNEGSLTLTIGNDRRTENIDEKGRVEFRQVSTSFVGDTVQISLAHPDWSFLNNRNSIKVPVDRNIVKLVVVPSENLGIIKGRILDEYGDFIEGATISIDTISTMSDSLGRFSLAIPRHMRQRTLTALVVKEGYRSENPDVMPSKTDEAQIVLQKKIK